MKKSITPWLIVLSAPAILFACMLFGPSGYGLPGTDSGAFILRLNRVIAGFVVGAALACAGVVLQALLRNPLAEPYVLGVSSGAGLGAALAILTGLTAITAFALPLSAFIMAIATLALVCALARQGGRTSVYALVISGVIVSAVFSSLLMFLTSRAKEHELHTIIWWMLGNMGVNSVGVLRACSLIILLGIPLAWILARDLNALTLGKEMAHHLGVRTDIVVTLGLVVATLISAAAVSMTGLIGFVGLIVPHVMRKLVGPDHRRLIPLAAIGGGLFLAVCDAIARTIIKPEIIPVGVMTALVGGPFFIAILRARRKQGWIE